jgi:DNA invertase Pin-like site-specific DNA recombinase
MANTAKAVSYLRVSGKGQIDGDGFPRQREVIARYAKAHGIEVVDEFRDSGVSGTKDLDADRLARDLRVSEILLSEFRKIGVQVIAAESGTDLTVGDDDPTRVLIRQVLGAVAQFEKSVIVSKLRAARIRKRRVAGKCEGRKAFGDRPGEAEVLAYIRKLHRKPRGGERLSYAAIAERLNAEGVTTRTGKKWAPGTVYGILNRNLSR